MLPESLNLQGIGEYWTIQYHASNSLRTVAKPLAGQRLYVIGQSQVSAYQAAIRRFLYRKTRETLTPWLQGLAVQTGFSYERLRIANQITRWGSYSSRGTISLNIKLLFIPPILVNYVLLHELCHTVQLNHSPAFWQLLQQHEPDCQQHRRELRLAQHLIPDWLFYS